MQEGQIFGNYLRKTLEIEKQSKLWQQKVNVSPNYLSYVKKTFPHLIDELEGYAKGANVEFKDLWILALENEFEEAEKCTTVITNGGNLIGHNEDWNIDSKDCICILKKTINDLTIFELFYYNTLGGNSVSVNSNGIIQTINSLFSKDKNQDGMPRNIIARWLSESSSISKSFQEISNLKLASGYNYNIVSRSDGTWNMETSASNQIITKIVPPFVHTNHYISELAVHDERSDNTFCRYQSAEKNVHDNMTIEQMQMLLNDNSNGKDLSIFNERTIARTIIDVLNANIYIWLLREQEKGWIKYNLDFLHK